MNRRILLIDFDARTLAHWQNLLTAEGFAVACATTSAEVTRHLEHEIRPALVIIEPMMPGLDGYMLCRSLKSSTGQPAPAVIIASRIFRGQKYRGLARDAGADLFIEKPLADAALLEFVRQYVVEGPGAVSTTTGSRVAVRYSREMVGVTTGTVTTIDPSSSGRDAPSEIAASPAATHAATRASKRSAPEPAPVSARGLHSAAATLGVAGQVDSALDLGEMTDDEIEKVLDRLAMPGFGDAGSDEPSAGLTPAAVPADEAAAEPASSLSDKALEQALDRLELMTDHEGHDPKALREAEDDPRAAPDRARDDAPDLATSIEHAEAESPRVTPEPLESLARPAGEDEVAPVEEPPEGGGPFFAEAQPAQQEGDAEASSTGQRARSVAIESPAGFGPAWEGDTGLEPDTGGKADAEEVPRPTLGEAHEEYLESAAPVAAAEPGDALADDGSVDEIRPIPLASDDPQPGPPEAGDALSAQPTPSDEAGLAHADAVEGPAPQPDALDDALDEALDLAFSGRAPTGEVPPDGDASPEAEMGGGGVDADAAREVSSRHMDEAVVDSDGSASPDGSGSQAQVLVDAGEDVDESGALQMDTFVIEADGFGLPASAPDEPDAPAMEPAGSSRQPEPEASPAAVEEPAGDLASALEGEARPAPAEGDEPEPGAPEQRQEIVEEAAAEDDAWERGVEASADGERAAEDSLSPGADEIESGVEPTHDDEPHPAEDSLSPGAQEVESAADRRGEDEESSAEDSPSIGAEIESALGAGNSGPVAQSSRAEGGTGPAEPEREPPLPEGLLQGMDPGTAELLSSLEELEGSMPDLELLGAAAARRPAPSELDSTRLEDDDRFDPPTQDEERSLHELIDQITGRQTEDSGNQPDAQGEAEPGMESQRVAEEFGVEADAEDVEDVAGGTDIYYKQLLDTTPKSRTGVWIGVGIAAVIVIGTIVGAVMFGRGNGEPTGEVSGAAAAGPVESKPQDDAGFRRVPAADDKGASGGETEETSAGRPGDDATSLLGGTGSETPGAAAARGSTLRPVPRVAGDSRSPSPGSEEGAASRPTPRPARDSTPAARSDSGSRPREAARERPGLPAPPDPPPSGGGGDGSPVVELAQLDRPLKIVEYERPPLTSAARSAGVNARVFLQVLVGPDGRVRDARVLMDPGYGLGQAARQSVLQWRFTRPSKDLEPVRVWKTEVVEFVDAGAPRASTADGTP